MTDSMILVLGATGFTGRLISAYLAAHPDRLAHGLKLTLAGRSESKLAELVDSLPDTTNISLLRLTSLDLDLEHTALVINTIGPYFVHSPSVAHACARTSTHYLDLSGEPHHTFSLLRKYNTHSIALQSRSIIIPGCGYDSIPSDFAAYLSAKALFDIGELPASSTTIHDVYGGLSGGTIATALSIFSIPPSLRKLSTAPFSASPIVGRSSPSFKFIYKLVIPGLRSFTGSFFPMSTTNKAVVQRSYGLLELDHLNSDTSRFHYGSNFVYDEFLNVPNSLFAFLFSSTIITFMALLFFKPFRILATFLLPHQGSGPSKDALQKGYFKATNFTFAADAPTTYAKSTFKGSGDPGYLLTSIMISEAALSILVPSNSKINPSLPPLAHSGGLLTPSTALGDVLLQRLLNTGKFSADVTVCGLKHESRKDK